MSKVVEMAGRRFGLLLVLAPAGSKYIGRASRAAWRCKCYCGTETIVVGAHLREGMTQSCGCLAVENLYHG